MKIFLSGSNTAIAAYLFNNLSIFIKQSFDDENKHDLAFLMRPHNKA